MFDIFGKLCYNLKQPESWYSGENMAAKRCEAFRRAALPYKQRADDCAHHLPPKLWFGKEKHFELRVEADKARGGKRHEF
jgi:hypothetical protein